MMMKKENLGFTFIEILIVMMILALLSSFGLQYWMAFKQRYALSTSTLVLFSFIQQVQSEANWQNRNLTLFLFNQDNIWCFSVNHLEMRPKTCFMGDFYFLSPDRSVNVAHFTVSASLTFYGKRAMAQAGTIILQNSQGRTKIIISVRGRIRYCSDTEILTGIPRC